MARVVFDHVSKQYASGPPAVRDISFTIEDEELLVLVGPSGCGKSTALRMIAGLESVTSGSLFIGDDRVNAVAPKDRDVAMVFQSYALYPHMTCFDNMAFALKLRGMPRRDIEIRVNDAAHALAIENLLHRRPRELSGGQRQRVAIGRAIVRSPRVFLMDEPLSNLDAKLRSSMRMEIKRLHRELAATTVYVTHDQTEAMTLGDRIAVLRAGELLQIDTPEAIYERPSCAFVASFIGSPEMNLLPAELVARGEMAFVEGRGFAFPWRGPPGDAKRRVLVGVRPEHLHIEPREDAPAMPGVVELVESTGTEAFAYVSTDAGRVVVKLDGAPKPRLGETVRLSVAHGRLHVFDADTEARLEA